MLPQRLLDYRIKTSSKTEDLFTLGRLFSEVGEYASTIQQRAYALTARMCRSRLRKIECELLHRSAIRTPEDILTPPSLSFTSSAPLSSLISNLSSLTVSELEILYRQRPLRTEVRIAAGREHLTLFFETRIVNELSHRTPTDLTEQFKIDYCLLTHRAEYANLSTILNLPLGNPKDTLPFDLSHTYTPSELIAMLTLYEAPRTLAEREILIETVDYALNLLSAASPSALQPLANLTAHLVELHRRKIVRCPAWLPRLLSTTITAWRRSPSVPDTDMVFPLLTAALFNRTPSLERQAQRIINRCYRNCLASPLDFPQLISSLHTAITCSSYVMRFSLQSIAVVWNNLVTVALSSSSLTSLQIISLLEAAELTDSTRLSYSSQRQLLNLLSHHASLGDYLAVIYLHRLHYLLRSLPAAV